MKMHWSPELNVQKIVKLSNTSAIAMCIGYINYNYIIHSYFNIIVIKLISVRSLVGSIKKLVHGEKFNILRVRKI